MQTHKNISEVFYQLSVGIIYLLAALITLRYTAINGNAFLLWPSSGIALSILIRFGAKYAIGIFLGAFLTGLLVGDSYLTIGLISLGNTLEPLFALYLLKHLAFSVTLYRLYDYLVLILAGSIGAVVSASFGVGVRALTGYLPISDFFHTSLRWWMGDMLGILLLTPFLVMLSLRSYTNLIKGNLIERAWLIALSTYITFSIFTNWNAGVFSGSSISYLLIVPLAWSVLRFSQLMTSLIIFEYFIIAIWGINHEQGMFIDGAMAPKLTLLWVNFVAISLVTHVMAYSVNDRNTLIQAINSSKTETYIFAKGDMRFEFVNQAALDNLGISLSKALQLTPFSIKPLFSKQQFHELLQPLGKDKLEVLNFETVHQRVDGTIYPVEITIQLIQHADRACYLASVIDITERIERDHLRILGNHVCDLSPQAIVITDKENKIVRVNQTFTKITGYTENEVLGVNPKILNSGRHDENFFKQLWESLDTQGQWEGSLYNRRKNGELYLQHATIKVLHDAKGDIQNFIAMFRDITKEHDAAMQLQQLSEHDVLTALPNRLKLTHEFDLAVTSAKRHRNKLAVLFFDLNDFKPINDNYGHMYGDKVLQVIADRMKACIRDTDRIARIGGDEFVVLMTNIDTDSATQTLINKLKATIVKPILVDEFTFRVSSSSGMAEYPKQGKSLDTLLDAADAEMYKDKAKMKSV